VVDENEFVHCAGLVELGLPEEFLADFVGERLDLAGAQVFESIVADLVQHLLAALDRHVVNVEVELE
jgi:hypothetical protein